MVRLLNLVQKRWAARARATGSTPGRTPPMKPDELRAHRKALRDAEYLPARQWLAGPGTEFKDPKPFTNYITRSKSQPFPLNPFFKAVSPLSLEAREKLFSLYCLDPVENSIARLAFKYSIPEERVQSTIYMRLLAQRHLDNGGTLQTNYARGMDALLCATELENNAFKEQKAGEKKAPLVAGTAPYIIAINEQKAFSQHDALKILLSAPKTALPKTNHDKNTKDTENDVKDTSEKIIDAKLESKRDTAETDAKDAKENLGEAATSVDDVVDTVISVQKGSAVYKIDTRKRNINQDLQRILRSPVVDLLERVAWARARNLALFQRFLRKMRLARLASTG